MAACRKCLHSQNVLEQRVYRVSHSPGVGYVCDRAGVGHSKTTGTPGEVERPQQRGSKATARFPEATGRCSSEPERERRGRRGATGVEASLKNSCWAHVRTSHSREPEPSDDDISQAQTSTLCFCLLPAGPRPPPASSNPEAKDSQMGQKSRKEKRSQLPGPTWEMGDDVTLSPV